MKTKKKTPKFRTSYILPKLAFFTLIILAHDLPRIRKSKYADLQNCQNIDFFEVDTLTIIKDVQCSLLTENMTIVALDRLKFRNHNSFFKYLLLLSGDINLNPGPTNNPCIICTKSVSKRGLCCANCGIWMHKNVIKLTLKLTQSNKILRLYVIFVQIKLTIHVHFLIYFHFLRKAQMRLIMRFQTMKLI